MSEINSEMRQNHQTDGWTEEWIDEQARDDKTSVVEDLFQGGGAGSGGMAVPLDEYFIKFLSWLKQTTVRPYHGIHLTPNKKEQAIDMHNHKERELH